LLSLFASCVCLSRLFPHGYHESSMAIMMFLQVIASHALYRHSSPAIYQRRYVLLISMDSIAVCLPCRARTVQNWDVLVDAIVAVVTVASLHRCIVASLHCCIFIETELMPCWPLHFSDSTLTVEVSIKVEMTMVELTLGQWSSIGLGVQGPAQRWRGYNLFAFTSVACDLALFRKPT
jgi:hypothetical protein